MLSDFLIYLGINALTKSFRVSTLDLVRGTRTEIGPVLVVIDRYGR